MSGTRQLLQVGAPDPEHKNSPIFDGADRGFLSMDLELETGVCYFNDKSFPLGSYVCSGDELLRCEDVVCESVKAVAPGLSLAA